MCTTRTWVKWSGWTPSSGLPSMHTSMSRSQGPVPSELTAARGTSSTSVIRWLITARGPGITYLLPKGLWRGHDDAIKALLALCVGNSPVTGEFPSQRPVTRSFDVFFDHHLNDWLSKQSWGWWYETPSRSLWRHDNEYSRFSCVFLWLNGMMGSMPPLCQMWLTHKQLETHGYTEGIV